MKKKLAAKGAAQATEKQYHDLLPVDSKINPLKWWKANELIYPAEVRHACRYLAITASSAPCERLFSTVGRVLEKRRASMKPETARSIVFLHENRHLLPAIQEVQEESLNDDSLFLSLY